MAITKEKKVAIVKKLAQEVAPSNSLVFVNFHGLSVADTTTLRKALRSEGTGLMVAKKTLIRRALGETKIEGEIPELAGEVAVAYGADPIAPARGVQSFAKTRQDKLQILGGVYEGKYASAALMLELASIPGREVLLGKLVNLLSSPYQRLVMTLDAISKKQ